MAVCIPKSVIAKMEKIDWNADSVGREKQLTELLDSNTAKEVNKAFERSLLLKNQETAFDKFLANFTEIGQKAKQELKDKLAKELQRKRELMFNPDGSINPDFERLLGRTDEDILNYSKKVFDKKYNLDISMDEANVINKLKNEAQDLSKKAQGTVDLSPERIAQAEKVVTLGEYIETLVNPEENLGFIDTIKDILKKTGQRYEGKTSWEKVLESGKIAYEASTSAVYKSIQASVDASFAFRQGLKVLANNPRAWRDNMLEAFKPFLNITKPKDKWMVMHNFKVNLAAKELYQQALDSKLAIGVIEEFFPSTLAERIPGLGRLFKASNEAFTIFSQGSRMSLFEDMVRNSVENGTVITKELSKEFAMLANSITGRGNLGDLEKISSQVNKLLYSGRFIKSQLDTFYLPFKPGLSPETRALAMKSSLKTLGLFASLMATASMFTEVETDPRSSKFGKAKVPGTKDTWTDLSGGMGSYITLAAREATRQSKSATTGKITQLNTGEFGSKTGADVIINFLTNKLAPAPGAILDIIEGRTFSGEKPTPVNTVTNLATPISIGNMIELFQNEETGPAFIATIFDLLGAGQTDYTKFK